MKIIKKGIEKRYFHKTTPTLKGYVIERYGDIFYVTQSASISTYSGDITIACAVWVSCSGSLLEMLIIVFEEDKITKGAIVDKKGVEQERIEIIKYL